MEQNDLLRRYLDAGIAFTQMTQARAEAIVRDLVKAGEVQTDQAQAAVSDLVDRSRKNTERLVEQVRNEVRDQVSNWGLATKDDINRLERQISSLRGSSSGSSATKRSPAKKRATKKSAAKRSPAKKRAAKKSPAKKTSGR